MKEILSISNLLCFGMIALVIAVSVWTFSIVLTMEKITIQGDVVDVDAYEDYMEIFLDNGESYRVFYPDDTIDLTKASTIIMRLENTNYFWFDDGIWDKVSITKIPSQESK